MAGEPNAFPPTSIDARLLAFMSVCRTAVLATLSERGQPRLVPICFVVATSGGDTDGTVIWSPLDAKPKRDGDGRRLARVRDIAVRPEVTLLFERWSEDWTQLAWLRARGLAMLVEPTDDAAAHQRAVEALRAKYPQYRTQPIDGRPMIRVVLTGTTSWSASSVGMEVPPDDLGP
jgi:PPOX class probable F420-dependent enzyme